MASKLRQNGRVAENGEGAALAPSLFRLLLVEDDVDLLRILKASFERAGYTVVTATRAKEGLAIVGRGGIDLVLADFQMPEMSGLELLRLVKEQNSSLPVIIMTAYGTISSAVEAMKQGAFDYVTKPFHIEELKIAIGRALRYRQALAENRILRETLALDEGLDGMIGKSKAIRRVAEVARKVARTDSTILITGESGTGKDVLARAIHSLSHRSGGPFVAVNCASIPETLLESELFGYRKGAFTGAFKDKAGRFEVASGGDLFLDEIAETKYELQAKLLRAIQEKSITRIGDNQPIPVNVRIIAATNSDLGLAVRQGRFREDLYYRISVIPIHLPSLRDRKEDIPLLIGHILSRLSPETRVTVDRGLLQQLMDHPWPGNIRELENVLERMVILRESDLLTVDDLPPDFDLETPALGEGGNGNHDFGGMTLPEAERRLILQSLERNSWNKAKAARELGILRHVLLYRLKKFCITPPGE